MKLLFKFLFRSTARKLTAEALNVGVRRGFDMGRQYEHSHLRSQGLILDLRVSNEIDQILAKAGW